MTSRFIEVQISIYYSIKPLRNSVGTLYSINIVKRCINGFIIFNSMDYIFRLLVNSPFTLASIVFEAFVINYKLVDRFSQRIFVMDLRARFPTLIHFTTVVSVVL